MTDIVANFELNKIEFNPIKFELSESNEINNVFSINVTPEKVSQIKNDLNYQTEEHVNEIVQTEIDVIKNCINSEVERLETEIEQSKSKTFVFEQGIPSNIWEITHNLNKFPSVTLVNSSGKVFLSEVDYIDNNSLIVHINGTTSGKAYLM